MKKCTVIAFSGLLVFSMLLATFGSAKADVGDDAVVTPVFGDMVFTTASVPLTSLPGTLPFGQMLVPAGFRVNEAQFGGNGLLVKGMDSGKATVCYSIRSIDLKSGWGGKVGMWNGTKWVLLPTTITTPDETVFSTACASINGSGTYAFIKYIADKSLLPQSLLNACNFDIEYLYGHTYGYLSTMDDTEFSIGLNVPESVAVGTPVTYSIINVDPAWPGSITTGLTGSTTVADGMFGYWAPFDEIVTITKTPGPAFTAHFVFPTLNCFVDLNYPAYGADKKR